MELYGPEYMHRKFNISLFFALMAQVQKRDFGKVRPPERTVRYRRYRMAKLVYTGNTNHYRHIPDLEIKLLRV